jgi:dipeptidyl aminopeptidase/acylaminoacyl peptidase
MAAYLSAAPRDGRKRPAIVWIFGGFDNGIGETAWEPASPDNDQSARAFRQAGVITLYPSVRGGNRNPGFKEGFLGEVEDVIAAAQWLATQPGVDPKRIYLGGHSTGGTLALLTAASTSSLFRAVISFGPIDDIRGYGQENLPFDVGSREEVLLRSPIVWLDGIQTPTAVIEGEQQGNIEAVVNMARQTKNPKLRFVRASGHDHFSVLAHATPLVARAILADTGPTANLALTGVGTDIGP